MSRSWESQVFHNIPQKDIDSSDGKDIGRLEIKCSRKDSTKEDTVRQSKSAENQKEKEKTKDRREATMNGPTEKEAHSDKENDSEGEVVYSASGAYFPPELLSTPAWDIVMGSAAAPTFFPVRAPSPERQLFTGFLYRATRSKWMRR